MKIIDDYLEQDHVDALNNLHIEYAKVHWVGAASNPDTNALTKMVHSTYNYVKEPALGATAWYNVRPVDPVWHNDSGGHLEIGGPGPVSDWKITTTFEPIPNRLIYFNACLTHRVQPYEGNRVSIGIVWWKITPDRYEEQKIDEYNVLERVWK